jgi:hypothetical protein
VSATLELVSRIALIMERVSSINTLFVPRRPTAISRLVVTVVIDSVDRKYGGRTFSNVC